MKSVILSFSLLVSTFSVAATSPSTLLGPDNIALIKCEGKGVSAVEEKMTLAYPSFPWKPEQKLVIFDAWGNGGQTRGDAFKIENVKETDQKILIGGRSDNEDKIYGAILGISKVDGSARLCWYHAKDAFSENSCDPNHYYDQPGTLKCQIGFK